MIALALLLPWVAVLVAARRHHHLDIGTVAAVSIGLATLWVAWATFRGPKRPDNRVNGLTVGRMADQLAVAVGSQWEAEASVRRLNDPYPSPGAVLARDQRAALILLLAGGLGVGLVVGLGVGLGVGIVVGLAAGLGFGLLVSGGQTASPSYLLTVGWLAFGNRLPRLLMSFLADAHQRGVLRRVGAVYQFRHIELQHRLAKRDLDKQGSAR